MVFDNLSKLLRRKIFFNNLSHIPGSMIDDLYVEEAPTVTAVAWRFIKSKIIFLILFPPLSIINIFSNAISGIFYQARSLFSSDKTVKDLFKEKAALAFDESLKNVFGLLFLPIGILFTREYSFLFLAPRVHTKKVVAGGSYIVTKTTLKQPTSIEELKNLVLDANLQTKRGHKVSLTIRGAGASQGEQFLAKSAQSIVIDLSRLNRVTINQNRNTITVGAGATWGEIEEIIAPHGLAVEVRQASNIFSVGGSLSANVHGWAHKKGCLDNTVKAIKVITPNGELKTLTPDDELFGYVLGGWGMFGVIVEAELQVIPNELLKEQGKLVNISDYIDYYHTKSGTTELADRNHVAAPLDPQTRMHLFRLDLSPDRMLKSGIAVQYVAQEDSPSAHPVSIKREAPFGTRFQRVMTNIARYFGFVRGMYWKMEAQRILAGEDQAITTVEHMQAPIRAMFNNSRSESEWLQEYFIPGDQLASFLDKLGDLLMENNVALLNASVRPVVKDSISKLAYAPNEDMYAVVLCFNQKLDAESRLKTRRWIKNAVDLTLAHHGTYYLPYQPFATRKQFIASYPQYQDVLAKKHEIDPLGIFESGFMDKYFKPKDFNPYALVCADDKLLEEFGGFLKNILVEIEPEKFNVLIKDIMSYTDNDEDIFRELHRRINEIAPPFLTARSRELDSLTAIKQDLTEQAYELMQVDADPAKPLNGILEIGYPGRFLKPMIGKLGIQGRVEVMQENHSMTDIIQSGFPRPHSRSHKLDYSFPDLSAMDDESFDVVTCFVGLHHFNDRALEAFLIQLNRVTSANGSFLLVDHDVTDDKSRAMATLAHSVFNAVKGASLEEEFNETRQFRSLQEWQTILAQYGFEMIQSPRPMIRAGDPSLNTMVRFRKVATLEPILRTERIENTVMAESKPANRDISKLTRKQMRFKKTVYPGTNFVTNTSKKSKLTPRKTNDQ